MILDGKHHAQLLLATLKDECASLTKRFERTPSLHVILVGQIPSSQIYVGMKEKRAHDIGIKSVVHRLPDTVDEKAVLALISTLNHNQDVDGILVQLPLPAHIDTNNVIESICPQKDVDGLTSINLGRLVRGDEYLIPCTPRGCLHLIHAWKQDISGLHAVVVGRSALVGKSLALLLTGRDATVTLCHSKTINLSAFTRQADIVIAACGVPGLITGNHIKPGACVIDVGINRRPDGTLTGDVDFNTAHPIADAITPVPFGVGPMTVAYLMANTLRAMQQRLNGTMPIPLLH